MSIPPLKDFLIIARCRVISGFYFVNKYMYAVYIKIKMQCKNNNTQRSIL